MRKYRCVKARARGVRTLCERARLAVRLNKDCDLLLNKRLSASFRLPADLSAYLAVKFAREKTPEKMSLYAPEMMTAFIRLNVLR